MDDIIRPTFMIGRVHYGYLVGFIDGSKHKYFKIDYSIKNCDWVEITYTEYSNAQEYGLYPQDGSIQYNKYIEKLKNRV